MILSILIPTLPSRAVFLRELMGEIAAQINAAGLVGSVEVLQDDDFIASTGAKRNRLLARASGKYCWFVDDDDLILPGAIENLVKIMVESGPDVIGVDGYMSTDGGNPVDWEIRLGNPYTASVVDGRTVYLRHPNHITPMLTEIARSIPFPDVFIMEDYRFAVALKESGLLKTECVCPVPVYHYRYRSKK